MQLSLERKPNAVNCQCVHCSKPIEKNDVRFRFSAYGYRQSINLFYHPDCFFQNLENMCLDFAKESKIKVLKKRKFLQGFHLAESLCGK